MFSTSKRLPAALLRQLSSHQARGAQQANSNTLALLSRTDSLVGVLAPNDANQGKRYQSSAVAAVKKTEVIATPLTLSIPFRHSIKAPPKVLRHQSQELQQFTEQLLTASPGSLFGYQDSHTTTAREDAWKAAESTVQLAEYVLRGHASWIPGSLYYKKTKNEMSGLTVAQHVAQMKAIITRLQQEGQVYMQLRHERLAQKFLEKQAAAGMQMEQGTDELPTLADTTKQFAPPGPTVSMYDALLDSMAVMAAGECELEGTTTTTTSTTPIEFVTLLRQIHAAHTLDGGDAINTNLATFPTMQSFNATLRGIASCKFTTGAKEDEQPELELIRDQAMEAFGIYNSMAHTTSQRLKRNSATITYMLQIVKKYIPTSRTKGNIAFTIWMQATKEGIVDTNLRTVQQSYKEANTPSNGVEFDDLVHERCDPEFVLPTKWIRHSKNRRHDPTGTY